MFSSIKLWGSIAVICLLTAVGVFVYNTYNSMKSQIETLIANNTTLKSVVDEQSTTLDAIEDNQKRQRILITDLQEKMDSAEQDAAELRQIFSEHNLTRLANEKPKLIEDRINDATNDVFRDLESISAR
jgi:predicted nuclease with TOPRIM domain